MVMIIIIEVITRVSDVRAALEMCGHVSDFSLSSARAVPQAAKCALRLARVSSPCAFFSAGPY